MNSEEIMNKVRLMLIDELNKDRESIDNKIANLQEEIKTMNDIFDKRMELNLDCPSVYGLEDDCTGIGCDKCWEIAIQKENVK